MEQQIFRNGGSKFCGTIIVVVYAGGSMLLAIHPDDDSLSALDGNAVPSSLLHGVVYHVGKLIGEGGMALAFLALRASPQGACPVVLKLIRPSMAAQSPPSAALIMQKEAVALGRINERVPTTPFVVRLFDAGSIRVEQNGRQFEVPWVAVEYVDGGAEGTTLSERVQSSVREVGHAFDSLRAARAIECLAQGLTAVHEVGVIHRDIKPDNIFCCGQGEQEIFKVADFGVARPLGLTSTFGGIVVGTPGYAPPELIGLEQPVGQWTDVFSLAATFYYLLTGEDYFSARVIGDAIASVRSPRRRSVLEASALAPELRKREAACREIDQILARATAMKGRDRPQTAASLAEALVPWLRGEQRGLRTASRRRQSMLRGDEPTAVMGWSWLTLQHPGVGITIRDVAWESDGQCLAATNQGLSFWNGAGWHQASLDGLPQPGGVRFVYRTAPGRWLVGGDGGMLCGYAAAGVEELVFGSDTNVSFERLSGDIDDLAVCVGTQVGGPPALYALVGHRWLKPFVLSDVAVVSALARIDDARWIVAGTGVDGRGFAALYSPLQWEVTRLRAPAIGALLACAGLPDRGLGLAVGAGGVVLTSTSEGVRHETVAARENLSAVAIDTMRRRWVGTNGRLYSHEPGGGGWECAWEERTWTAPIVSIFASVEVVIAVSANGGIVEGRFIDLPTASA